MHGKQAIGNEVLLASLPLFSGLGAEELARVARGTRQIQAARDQLVFSKGGRCEGFHLVVLGQVKLVYSSAEGEERVVAILERGDTFGESLMLSDLPYNVSAVALSDAVVLHISKAVIFEEFDKDPGLRLKMVAGLSQRLKDLMEDVESLSLRSGKQRVVNYFLHLIPPQPPVGDAIVALPTSKANIASLLNLTQEHFSRILRDLANQGLIDVRGGLIQIPDIRKLRAELG